MLIGAVSTLAYIIYFKCLGGTKDDLFLGISPEGFGALGMVMNFIIAFIVSRVTPEPPEDIQLLVDNIRIPRDLSIT